MRSFSVTSSRLSQYLKEQQRLVSVARPAITISLLHELHVSPASDRRTLDLFPQHAGLGADAVPAKDKSERTIFYGGQMLVFHDFPADKAKDLMLMAGKGSSVDPLDSIGGKTGLPLKRRASLHRFMENRRERIKSSKNRYQMDEFRTDSSLKKPVTDLPWFPKSSQAKSN